MNSESRLPFVPVHPIRPIREKRATPEMKTGAVPFGTAPAGKGPGTNTPRRRGWRTLLKQAHPARNGRTNVGSPVSAQPPAFAYGRGVSRVTGSRPQSGTVADSEIAKAQATHRKRYRLEARVSHRGCPRMTRMAANRMGSQQFAAFRAIRGQLPSQPSQLSAPPIQRKQIRRTASSKPSAPEMILISTRMK